MGFSTQNKAYSISIALHLIGIGALSIFAFDVSLPNKELQPVKIRIIESKPSEIGKPVPKPELAELQKPKIQKQKADASVSKKQSKKKSPTKSKKAKIGKSIPVRFSQASPKKFLEPAIEVTRTPIKYISREKPALKQFTQAVPIHTPDHLKNISNSAQPAPKLTSSYKSFSSATNISPKSSIIKTMFAKAAKQASIQHDSRSDRHSMKKAMFKAIPLQGSETHFQSAGKNATPAKTNFSGRNTGISSRYGNVQAIKFSSDSNSQNGNAGTRQRTSGKKATLTQASFSASKAGISSRFGGVQAIKYSDGPIQAAKGRGRPAGIVNFGKNKIRRHSKAVSISNSFAGFQVSGNSQSTIFTGRGMHIGSRFSGQIISASIDSDWMEEQESAGNGKESELSSLELGKLKNAFKSQVRSRIAKRKKYPKVARNRNYEGNPVVKFTLAKNGAIMNLTLNESSSYHRLDKAALSAVRNSEPYPPIPEPLGLESMTFVFPINFSLSAQQ